MLLKLEPLEETISFKESVSLEANISHGNYFALKNTLNPEASPEGIKTVLEKLSLHDVAASMKHIPFNEGFSEAKGFIELYRMKLDLLHENGAATSKMKDNFSKKQSANSILFAEVEDYTDGIEASLEIECPELTIAMIDNLMDESVNFEQKVEKNNAVSNKLVNRIVSSLIPR